MARPHLIMVAVLATAPVPALGQAIPAAAPLTSPQLDEQRGGFELPGGATVALGVVTETRIDGQEVLRTIFSVKTGLPVIAVLARTTTNPTGGLTQLDATVGGASVTTADGKVTLAALPNGVRVELAGDRVDISHLVGQSLGSVVTNSADNRSIDVATTVNISLGGITRDAIGASGARVDALALDATSRLSH